MAEGDLVEYLEQYGRVIVHELDTHTSFLLFPWDMPGKMIADYLEQSGPAQRAPYPVFAFMTWLSMSYALAVRHETITYWGDLAEAVQEFLRIEEERKNTCTLPS